MTGEPSRLEYKPALDGLRGLAVAAVLVFHQGYAWAKGGFLGVSLFFTLSGFLITRLLLAEHAATGRIRLRTFWTRRARRLVPASLIALGLAIVVTGTLPLDQRPDVLGDIRSALANVANWRFIQRDISYNDLLAIPSPVEHYWSLAIEEQFYLVFPVLALFALRRSRRAFTVALGAIVAGALAVQLLMHDTNRVYFGSDARAAELAVGALLALALARLVQPQGAYRRLTDAAGWSALVLIGTTWWVAEQANPVLYRGGLAALAPVSALLIFAAMEGGTLTRALSWRPLVALGRVSYGVYLFHFPLFLLLSEDRTGWHGHGLFAARVTATLAVAVVSYLLVEMPVRHSLAPSRWVRPLALGMGVTAVITASLVVPGQGANTGSTQVQVIAAPAPVTTAPTATTATAAPSATSAVSATPATSPPSPGSARAASAGVPVTSRTIATAPALLREPRIVVVGDSTARANGEGLAAWGARTGRLSVTTVFLNGCALAPGTRVRVSAGVEQKSRPCDVFAQAAAIAKTIAADAIVAFIGSPQLFDLMFEGSSQWHGMGEAIVDDAYDAALRSTLSQLTGAGIPVLWASVPLPNWGALPGVSAGVGGTTMNNPDRTRRINSIDASIVPTFSGIARFPYAESLSNPDGSVNEELRPDGLHLSPEGVGKIADRWLYDQLAAAYRAAAGARPSDHRWSAP